MAILHDALAVGGDAAPAAPPPPRTPGLFVATVAPATVVSAVQPAALLPPRALARLLRARGCAPPAGRGDAQLVVSTETALELVAVDARTETLVRVERVPVFGRVRALARMRLEGGGGVDVLLVLAGASKISFVQWDERAGCLACVGSVVLFGMPAAGASASGTGVRREARLLVVHPRKKIAAVATLESSVAVFPVMFLADCVSAGKVASVPVDGVVLSMAFLEDEDDCEDGDSGDSGGGGGGSLSVLIALVQQEKRQFIAVFTVGVSLESSIGWGTGGGGGGLCISMLTSMSTCAARSEDIAVERIQAKRTGAKVKPPRTASSIAAVPGKPYLFVVCLDGRLVIADARATVCDIIGMPTASKRRASFLRPPSGPSRRLSTNHPQPNAERRGSSAPSHHGADAGGDADDEPGGSSWPAGGSEGPSGGQRECSTSGDQNDERMETDDCDDGSGPSGSASVNASALSDVASASQFESAAAGSGGALSSCPDGTTSADDQDGIQLSDEQELDAAANLMPGDEVEQEPAALQSHDQDSALELEGEQTDDDENPDTLLGEHHAESTTAAPADGSADSTPAINSSHFLADSTGKGKPGNGVMPARSASLSGLETYVSFLYMPPHFALDLPDSEDCHVGAMTSSGDHWGHVGAMTSSGDHISVEVVGDAASDSGGFYVIMESGSMYSLRWQSTMRSDRVPCFVIPRAGGKVADTTCGSRASPFFSVELIGNVGAASALAALTGNLLYISSDGSDGTLRFIAPSRKSSVPAKVQIRQNFLSLGPLSDIAVVSPFKRAQSQSKRSMRHRTRRNPVAHTVGSSSALLRKRKSRSSKDVMVSDTARRSERLEEGLKHVDSYESPCELEGKLLVCSGIGESGTVRILQSGAAFSVFSSSGQSFPGCNGMWSIRTSRESKHHAYIVMTFAESTGVYCIAPPRVLNQQEQHKQGSPSIAELIDGSEASRFRLDCRTIASGSLADGVLVQIHRDGVRLVKLLKATGSEESGTSFPQRGDGLVTGSLAEHVLDWKPPSPSFIVAGCVDVGNIVVAARDTSNSGTHLYHLRHIDNGCQGLHVKVVSQASVVTEVSSLALPSWVKESASGEHSTLKASLDVVIVTTYDPAVELRSLSRGLDVVSTQLIDTCPLNDFQHMFGSEHEEHLDLSKSSPYGGFSKRAGSVPESACGLEFGSRRIVAVGLRDGRIITFLVSPGQRGESQPLAGGLRTGADCDIECLQLLSCRRLGRKPVRVRGANLSSGSVLLAECERPWAGTLERHSSEWTPLQFSETRAAAAISFVGAERCLVMVSGDGSLHIGAVKRLAPVSVSTIRVGATPRRVCSMTSLGYSYAAVATSGSDCEVPKSELYHRWSAEHLSARLGFSVLRDSDSHPASSLPQLRVYDLKTRSPVCRAGLMPNELVHVLFCWRSFIVVGTSLDLHSSCAEDFGVGNGFGRLLLYSMSSISPVQSLEECCRLVLPGAVLAGAVNDSDDCIVVSSKDHIYAFTLTPDGLELFEIARTSTRMVVVSLSIRQGLVCAGDRKDSIVFYRVNVASQRLVRCRGDYRKRVVADAILVDDHTAIAIDRLGNLFSLAYDLRDQVRLPESLIELLPTDIPRHLFLFGQPQSSETSHDFNESSSTAEEDGAGDDDESSASGGSHPLLMEVPHNLSEGGGEDLDAMDAAVAEAEGRVAEHGSASLSEAGSGSEAEQADQGSEEEGGNLVGVASVNDSQPNESDSFVIFPGPQPIQRHLVSNHAIGLDDIPVRVRSGSLARRERQRGRRESFGPASKTPFWDSSDSCVLVGTLSGAIVAVVPLNLQETYALFKLSAELVRHDSLLGSAIGTSHAEYRGAYGKPSSGVLDGDLLLCFCSLSKSDQDTLASAAGFPSSKSALAFVELIQSLWSRVC